MSPMMWLLVIFLIIIVAYLVGSKLQNNRVTGIWEMNELQECTNEINRIAGGVENVVSLKVLNKIMPYLREVDTGFSNVEEYLLKYFEYPEREISRLKQDALDNTDAPKKYKLLHTIIDDIIRRNNIDSVEEFFKKSKLTYREFLPESHRKVLADAARYAKVSKDDLKKLSKIYDKYFINSANYLTKDKLLAKTEDLIADNKLFKLKPGRADMPIAKLKALAEREPHKVFELDYVGLMPAMKETSESYDTHSSKRSTYSREDDIRRQLEEDIETLKLFRDYPSRLRRDSDRWEIARRLESAASKLYSPRYAAKLLRDLYYDYDPLYKNSDYGLGSLTGRYNAERERDSAISRAAQVAAEKARDEERAFKDEEINTLRAERARRSSMTNNELIDASVDSAERHSGLLTHQGPAVGWAAYVPHADVGDVPLAPGFAAPPPPPPMTAQDVSDVLNNPDPHLAGILADTYAAHGRGEISDQKRDELVMKLVKASNITGGSERAHILNEVTHELKNAKKDNMDIPLIPLN